MFKAQWMSNKGSVWSNIGTYSSEREAISMAQNKKNSGAFAVRVTDNNGSVIWSG